MSELILPALPGNLESLHTEEETIRTKSVLYVNAEPELKEHSELIQDSLNVLFDMLDMHHHRTDDELTIQYLGIRLFNSAVASLKLMLSGYYQLSFSLQRDIVETGFLVDYLSEFPAEIMKWKAASDRDSEVKYKPSVIREALDKRDKVTGKKRGQIYGALCKYASHPSYQGFKLLAPEGLGKIGPFYDEKSLKAALGELVQRSPFFTLVFLTHFKKLPEQFLKPHISFLSRYKAWGQKYLKVDLSHIDVETAQQLLELL